MIPNIAIGIALCAMAFAGGRVGVVTDRCITRLPEKEFCGGATGVAKTRNPHKSGVAAVTRVLNAFGGPSKIQFLLTGHSLPKERCRAAVGREKIALGDGVTMYDKWRLDRKGIRLVENNAVKKALGFSNVQSFTH